MHELHGQRVQREEGHKGGGCSIAVALQLGWPPGQAKPHQACRLQTINHAQMGYASGEGEKVHACLSSSRMTTRRGPSTGVTRMSTPCCMAQTFIYSMHALEAALCRGLPAFLQEGWSTTLTHPNHVRTYLDVQSGGSAPASPAHPLGRMNAPWAGRQGHCFVLPNCSKMRGLTRGG